MCGCKWKISVDDAAMPCSSSTSGLREVAGPGFLRRGCKRGQRKTQPAGGDKVPNNRAVKKNKMSCVLTVFVTKSVTGSLQRGTQSSVATEQLTKRWVLSQVASQSVSRHCSLDCSSGQPRGPSREPSQRLLSHALTSTRTSRHRSCI